MPSRPHPPPLCCIAVPTTSVRFFRDDPPRCPGTRSFICSFIRFVRSFLRSARDRRAPTLCWARGTRQTGSRSSQLGPGQACGRSDGRGPPSCHSVLRGAGVAVAYHVAIRPPVPGRGAEAPRGESPAAGEGKHRIRGQRWVPWVLFILLPLRHRCLALSRSSSGRRGGEGLWGQVTPRKAQGDRGQGRHSGQRRGRTGLLPSRLSVAGVREAGLSLGGARWLRGWERP